MTKRPINYEVALFNGTRVYVIGYCQRADEGIIGHDLQCRPVHMGWGDYTFVTAPDCLERFDKIGPQPWLAEG